MKSKLEKALDAAFVDMGVKTRIYHLKDMWPFTGVTIVIENREWRYYEVFEMVREAIVPDGLNRATKLKKNLNSIGIYGVAICDLRDQYNTRRGRTIAKGRLLVHLRTILAGEGL